MSDRQIYGTVCLIEDYVCGRPARSLPRCGQNFTFLLLRLDLFPSPSCQQMENMELNLA